MLQLCGDYRENVKRTDELLRVQENFDIIKKVLFIGKQGLLQRLIGSRLAAACTSAGEEHGHREQKKAQCFDAFSKHTKVISLQNQGLVSTTMKKGDVGELTILTRVAHTRWREMPAR